MRRGARAVGVCGEVCAVGMQIEVQVDGVKAARWRTQAGESRWRDV